MTCNTFNLSHEVSLVFPNIDWRRDKLLPPPRLRGPVDESNLCLAIDSNEDYTPGDNGGGTTNISELCLSWFRNPVVSGVLNGVITQCPTTHYLLQWSLSEDFSSGNVQERILANPPVFDYYYYCLTFPNEFRNGETIYWRVTAANLSRGAVSPPSETRKLTLNCSNDDNSERSKYDIKQDITGCDPICIGDCCLFGVTGSFKSPKSPNPDAIEISKTEWGVETCDGTVEVDKDNPRNQNEHVMLDLASDNDQANAANPPQNENTLLLTAITDTPQVIKVCVRKTYKYTNTSLNRDDFEVTECKKVLITQCGNKSGCTVKFQMPREPIEADSCVSVIPIEYSDNRNLPLNDAGQIKEIIVCNCTGNDLICDCCGFGFAVCWENTDTTLPLDIPDDYVFDAAETDPDAIQRHMILQVACTDCCALPLANGNDDAYIIPPVDSLKGTVLDVNDNGFEIDVPEFQGTIVYVGCEPGRLYIPGSDIVIVPLSSQVDPSVDIFAGDDVFLQITEDCEFRISRACLLEGFFTSTNLNTELCLQSGEYEVQVISTNGTNQHIVEFLDFDFSYSILGVTIGDCPVEVGDILVYRLFDNCSEEIEKICIFTSASPGSPDIVLPSGCVLSAVRGMSPSSINPSSGNMDFIVEILEGQFAGQFIFLRNMNPAEVEVDDCVELCINDCCRATIDNICGQGLLDGRCYPGRLTEFTQHDAFQTRVMIEEFALTEVERECLKGPFEVNAIWWSNACGQNQDRVIVCVHNCNPYAYLSGINIHSSDISDESIEDVNILGEKDGCIVHIDTQDCEDDGGGTPSG